LVKIYKQIFVCDTLYYHDIGGLGCPLMK